MTSFGWSYPPGCSGPPDEYDGPCEVCGQIEEACICPECPTCGQQGDPYCYDHHGLTASEKQIVSLAAAKKEWEDLINAGRDEE